MAPTGLYNCPMMASILFRGSLRAVPGRTFSGAIRLRYSTRFSSTKPPLNSYLVTPQALFEALMQQKADGPGSKVIPLCAAWFLPNDELGRTGRKVFEERRIPSARFFDIDEIKDLDSSYPHMLPTAEGFAEAMSRLGLKREDSLVVYDSYEQGIFSAPRAAFTLKVFGHPRVHILNNFRLYVEQGYPLESGKAVYEAEERTKYPVPNINPDRVACFRDVKSVALDYTKPDSKNKVQIIDARSAGRFDGTAPEPRPTIPSGHIPGSFNIPLPDILDSKTKAFLSRDDLRKVFERKGLDPKRPIISSCGTGVMAAALDAALSEADFGAEGHRRVYDGSWTEYAQRVKPEEGLIVKQT